MKKDSPDYDDEEPLFQLGVPGEERPLFELGAQAEDFPDAVDFVNPIHQHVANVEIIEAPKVMLASRGRRLVAKVLDLTFVSAAFYAGSIFLIAKLPDGPQWGPAIVVGLFGFVGVWLTWFIYNTALKGNTWGKWLLGSRVIDDQGDPLTYGKAFGRSWAESLTVLVLGLGYLFALFDRQKRTLHDHLVGTRVVRR